LISNIINFIQCLEEAEFEGLMLPVKNEKETSMNCFVFSSNFVFESVFPIAHIQLFMFSNHSWQGLLTPYFT